MSTLIANPEDRFSCDEAHIKGTYHTEANSYRSGEPAHLHILARVVGSLLFTYTITVEQIRRVFGDN